MTLRLFKRALLALALLAPIQAYAQGGSGIPINKLQPGSPLQGSELIPMFQGTNPARTTTPSALKTYLGPPSGVAGGDLGGTYPNPSVLKIQGVNVAATTPAPGLCLVFVGTFPTGAWTPGSCSGVSGVTSFNSRTGAVVPVSGDYSFSLLSGVLGCAQMPVFTGDVSNSSCALTVLKVNGVSFGITPSVDTVPVITASNTATYTALPNCSAGYLQYSTSTHLFACGTLGTGVATALGTAANTSGGFATSDNARLGGTPTMPALGTGTCANGVVLDVSGNVLKGACPGAASSIQVGTTTVTSATQNTLLGPGTVTAGTGTLGAVAAGYGISITTSTISLNHTSASNSLGADVNMSSIGTYFDGPSTAQGTTGTWFASGTVTMVDSSAATFACKLWDGTTVIASAQVAPSAATNWATISLSGVLASPAANIKISCKDTITTTGKILFNASGNSKDSTLTVVRIN